MNENMLARQKREIKGKYSRKKRHRQCDHFSRKN